MTIAVSCLTSCGSDAGAGDGCDRFGVALARLAARCGFYCPEDSCAAELADGCREDLADDERQYLDACIVEVQLCDCAGLEADTCSPVCNLILD